MTDDRSPGDAGSAHATPPGIDRVLSLIQQVGGLAPRVGFERSFKLTAGRLSQDRFLLGVDRPFGNAGLDKSVDRVCDAIGMPPELHEAFGQSLARANHVYFGAERDGQTLTFKAYLEFSDAIATQLQVEQSVHQPVELYTGYKWDATSRSRRAVSHYIWYPFLSMEGILHRVHQIVDVTLHPMVCNVFASITRRALEVVAPPSVQFLDVREDGNPRQSLDINVYKAGYRMDDLRTLLMEAAQHYAIGLDEFDRLFRRISGERFGHLAGGVDREGRDFLTFYFGGAVTDGSRLQSARPAPNPP